MLSAPWLLLLAAAAAALIRLLRTGRRPKNYPPGPPTIPILGNMHLMPPRDVHLQFQKWAREYGPVYSLILGTKTLVVLSSDKAVKDLLDKRSSIYSDRPEMYVGQELCSDGLRMVFMPYGPRWRTSRKLAHQFLNPAAAKTYEPYQMLENRQMLHEMLTQPERFLDNIRRYSGAIASTIVFGFRMPTYDDPDVNQLFDGVAEFAALSQTGSAAAIDFFPLLRVLPDFLLPTQRRAKAHHKRERELYVGHWLRAKEKERRGELPECFSSGLARVQDAEGFSDAQAAYIGCTLLEAGADTTANTLYGFVQAMLLFPEVQRRAQAEIDGVVGDKRMPTWDDEPTIQYVRCCVKESMRWMPTTLMGAMPHAVTRDDVYDGFLIPKGAGVVNNVWTIHMDPARYPDPRRFDPDRFRNDRLSAADSAAHPDPSQRDHFVFGAGRRVCSGIHVAERSLFLAVSRLLWAFDISPALGPDGRPEAPPDPDRITQGFVCMPEEYRCRITPRSEARAEAVEREWREAERECLDPETKQWRQSPLEKGKV